MTQERRKLPRYLCSEHFSESTLTFAGSEYDLLSINFNRRGIALYTDQRLPDGESAMISFAFHSDETDIQIARLACFIRHRHETEVGHRYGIEFDLQSFADSETSEKLNTIELELADLADEDDRYGLYDL